MRGTRAIRSVAFLEFENWFHIETLLTERRKDKEVFLGWYTVHIVQYICVFLLTTEEPDIAKSKKSVHVRKQVRRTWKMHEDQYSFSILPGVWHCV